MVTVGLYTQPCQIALAAPKAFRIRSSESNAAKYRSPCWRAAATAARNEQNIFGLLARVMVVKHPFGKRGLLCPYHFSTQRLTEVHVPFGQVRLGEYAQARLLPKSPISNLSCFARPPRHPTTFLITDSRGWRVGRCCALPLHPCPLRNSRFPSRVGPAHLALDSVLG